MAAISSRIVGAAGEHYVLCQLLRRGGIATQAPDGAPNMDIIVTDTASTRLCSLQVKARRDIGADRGWHMKQKHEEIIAPDLFYAFVDFGRDATQQPACFLLPSQVVADVIAGSHRVWLAMPGRNGQAHNDTVMRRFLPSYDHLTAEDDAGARFIREHRAGWLEPYREGWDILGLPMADGF